MYVVASNLDEAKQTAIDKASPASKQHVIKCVNEAMPEIYEVPTAFMLRDYYALQDFNG